MSDRVTEWRRHLELREDRIESPDVADDAVKKSVFRPEFAGVSRDEFQRLWDLLASLASREALHAPSMNALLEALVRDQATTSALMEIGAAEAKIISEIHEACGPFSIDRHRLLQWLATTGQPEAWAMCAALLAVDPPRDIRHLVEVVAPFWKTQQGPFNRLFPRILDAVEHPSAASVVLDLANYVVRAGRLPQHPGRDRADAWTALLGDVVERLEWFEEASRTGGVPDLEVAGQVTEVIAVAISLTDALTLLDHRPAIGKFNRLLGLEHRRLRVEAAAALARMEEPAGLEALQALAKEPLVRLRALHYADEVGKLDDMPEEARRPESIAESQLVVRLAEPDLFGVPPRSLELLDRRELDWPCEEEPCECFLFRYHYGESPDGWSSIAIAGPFSHALPVDLDHLEVDDVYAAYAGASVEHPELKQVAPEDASPPQQIFLRRAISHLAEDGFRDVRPVFLGVFFGVPALVAATRRSSQAGFAVVDERFQAVWFPQVHSRGVDAETAYCIYLGRELLKHRNTKGADGVGDEESDEDE
jgi:hypothetical protein